MSLMNLRKSEAINAVKNENRLIADVSKQFGFTTRQVYQWLRADSNKSSIAQEQSNEHKGQSTLLKAQIKILQTEVVDLKSKLNQYQITERLENGKIILDFYKKPKLGKLIPSRRVLKKAV